jgi:hypothetical protein
MANNKRPITRLWKFYDETDFNLENDMSREFVEGDLNFTVVLFKVDRIKSQTDDVYGESSANEIVFHPPKELKVRPLLNEPESETYSEGYGRYQDYGNFNFIIELFVCLRNYPASVSFNRSVRYLELPG